jgi:hypothetical protein
MDEKMDSLHEEAPELTGTRPPGLLDHQVASYLTSIMDEEWVLLWWLEITKMLWKDMGAKSIKGKKKWDNFFRKPKIR